MNESVYGTNFLETEAILAAQDDNHGELSRLVEQMLPGERASLAHAAERLANVCREVNTR